jgi:hypothetical protein
MTIAHPSNVMLFTVYLYYPASFLVSGRTRYSAFHPRVLILVLYKKGIFRSKNLSRNTQYTPASAEPKE